MGELVQSSLFYWKHSEKPSKPQHFFTLCWAVWFKAENTCFCLKLLTAQFDCEEVSSLFCSDGSLYRSVCQCTIWGHYPDWGHQGDLYSSLCHWAGHAGNRRCCLHAKWDQCSQSSLLCFGAHWSLSVNICWVSPEVKLFLCCSLSRFDQGLKTPFDFSDIWIFFFEKKK